MRKIVIRNKNVRPMLLVLASAVPLALLMTAATSAPARPKKPAKAAPARVTFERDVAPLVKKYCAGCHGATGPSADLSLVGYKDKAAVLKARAKWEKVSANVGARHMPPDGSPQPTQAERDLMVGWIDATISQADCQLDDPGRVTMRRLNREEYNNTVRDLLGVDLRPADEFPSDDVGYGFDNIGDVLSISPLLMEKYMAAAEKIADAAIVTPGAGVKPVRFSGSQLGGAEGAAFDETGGRLLFSTGAVRIDHTFPADGEYVLRAEAWGQQAGPDPARMTFRLDGRDIRTVDVKATEDKPAVYEVRVPVTAGRHRFAAAFVNDFYDPQASGAKDRNLVVRWMEIAGGRGGTAGALPASHRRIIPRQPTNKNRAAVTREILRAFATRAYRRPATPAEVARLTRYVGLAQKEGESFERGIQLAVQAVLVSPHFLFRVELDKQPAAAAKNKRLVGQYEMASRLSYFLWSSMPDDELFKLAEGNRLQDPKVLEAQVRRMLKSPKSRALVDNFAAQWLQLRNLNSVTPDPRRFPDWDDELRAAMRTETEMFFEAVMREDRSILDLLDGKFTFLNERLARHYGNTRVKGEAFRKVALVSDQRGGILSQASILTITSNPTRTSPVKRGKWVLEQILGTPPPMPPPGVAELPDGDKAALTGTVRQRLEQHRSNPACASCHARMDPLGFGLENYDAVGAWRTEDGESPVDASGTLPDGKSFKGPAQLKAILKGKKAQFTNSFSEKLLTYALGRGVESYDRCNVDDIARVTAARGYRFSALVNQIVQSDPFRLRRADRKRGGARVASRNAAGR